MTMLDCLDKPHADGRSDGHALPLAFMRYDKTPDDDQMLARCGRNLQQSGYRVSGIVQSNRRRPERRACDMFLENLTTGEKVCISADRGNGARGCRLDHAALAQATLWAEQALTLKPQLLILNKFGKEEALGRGFFPVMAEALARDIPVLSGVSALNVAAAQAITGGVDTEIEPTEEAIDLWLQSIMRMRGNSPWISKNG
jgi:nucleoside-triphosphatase THEP1